MRRNIDQMNKCLVQGLMILLLLFAINVQAQNERELIPVDFSHTTSVLDKPTLDQLKSTTEAVMALYQLNADFKDQSTDELSLEKLEIMNSLFSRNALIVNDLARKPYNINSSDYIDLIMVHLDDYGVDFKVSEIYCEEIKNNGAGYYIANVYMKKTMYIGLLDNNQIKIYNSGRDLNLKFSVLIPEYDLRDGQISSISADDIQVAIMTDMKSYSFDPFYSWGTLYGRQIVNEAHTNVIGGFQPQVSKVGISAFYRKNLPNKQKLFWHAGLRVNRYNFITKINSFNSEGSTIFGYGTTIDTVRFVHHTIDGIGVQTGANGDELPISVVKISSLENASENLTAWGIQAPLGISMLLQEGFSSRIHLDVSLVPEVRFGLNGRIDGQIKGTQFPIDDSFPDLVNFNQNAQQITSDEYVELEDFSEIITSNEPSFALGLMLSPSYQFLNNFNSGLELGLDIFIDLLPAFKEKAYENDFLTGTDNVNEGVSINRRNAIHEDLFKASRVLSYGFKIGYYYEIR